jgi:hypothetical protein
LLLGAAAAAVSLFAVGAARAATSSLPSGERVDAKSPASKAAYSIKSDFQFGGADAPENAQFYEKGSPTQIGADAAGNIYVLDSGGPRIQVFDAKGRFVTGFGKAGEGPGEFKMPGKLAVAADGRVAVFDMAASRISIFDKTGKLLRDQLVSTAVQDMTFDGNNLAVAFIAPGGVRMEEFDPQGKSLWHVAPETAPAGGRVFMVEMDGETSSSRLAAGPQALYWASRDEYAVRRFAGGKVTHTWTRPFERQSRPPMPTSKPNEDGDGGSRMVVVQRRSEGGAAPTTEVQSSAHGDQISLDAKDIEKMLPKYRPDVRGLLAWPDGRVWVVTAADEGSNMVTDEWSADGTWRARFNMPRYDRVALGADGRLYALSHDKDEYAVVHRLAVTAEDGRTATP